VIKVISAANMHPSNRARADFFNYWRALHGPLFAHTPSLQRYVQHFSVDSASTHDGASMFWFADLDALRTSVSPVLSGAIAPAETALHAHYVASRRYGDPDTMTLSETVRADDRQLFDRATDWPTDHRRASVVAEERVVVDGPTSPEMIKVVYTAARKPGLAGDEFRQHWFEVHGELGARVPGLRRYVQNHGVVEAYPIRPTTHDGFSELWFDDMESLRRAWSSPEWAALGEDGKTLFSYPMSVVVAQEAVIKG
jgi:uncharacterized protein (TIGR02118 family)